MTDDIQSLINEWWELQPQEFRRDWWRVGDWAVSDALYPAPYLIVDILGEMLYFDCEGMDKCSKDDCAPAPCPQLWWRLETEYLGDDFKGYVWGYFTTFGKFTADDRRIALLDACIAKAKERT